MRTKANTIQAFSLVELLLAISLLSIFILSLIGVILYAQQSLLAGGKRARASYLVEETVNIIDAMAISDFESLVDGTYGLKKLSGSWQLSGGSDTVSEFTRTVTIVSEDAQNKSAFITLSWLTLTGVEEQITTTLGVTNWANGLPWGQIVAVGNLNLSGSETLNLGIIEGSVLYAIRSGTVNNLVSIDISDPQNPALLDELTLAGNLTSITSFETNTIIIGSDADTSEIQIVDISSPSNLNLVDIYDSLGGSSVVDIEYISTNSFAVLLSDSNSSELLKLSYNGGVFSELNTQAIAFAAYDLELVNNNLVVATADVNFEIKAFAVSDLSSAGNFDLTGALNELVITKINSTLIVGDDSGQLIILELADIETIQQVSQVNLGSAIKDIRFNSAANLVYVSTTDTARDLLVIDAGNLSNLSVRTEYDNATVVTSFIFEENTNHIYLLSSDAELYVISE